MVKSKFPGKPSKLVNRKLTRTSGNISVQQNEGVKLAEDISLGLSVFKEIFGSDEEDENSTFHGFSQPEVQNAEGKSKLRTQQVEEEYTARGVLFSLQSSGSKSTLLPASSLNKRLTSNSSPDDGRREFIPNNNVRNNVGHLQSVKRFENNGLIRKSKKIVRITRTKCSAVKDISSFSDTQDKGGTGLSRKFILPSRSVHSSRVIKPNKRFLDTDLDTGNTSSGGSSCETQDGISSGNNLKKPRLDLDSSEEDSSSSWGNNKQVCEDTMMASDGESNDTSEPGSSSSTTSSINRRQRSDKSPDRMPGKVIIRKARLKVDSELPSVKGPFSSKGGDKETPGTVVCGVCGAVRFYRFVKQARKFGVYSCESCRKFISKMIHNKRHEILQCNGNKGTCVVPPYVLNPLDSVRYSHLKTKNARCPACWLKMCLRCYCMPEDLRAWLENKLPDYMQDPAFISIMLSHKNDLLPNYIQYGKSKHLKQVVRHQLRKTKKTGNKYNDDNDDDSEPRERQKRKAAINSLASIARFAGRVTDEAVENQLLLARNLKKKATAIVRGEASSVVKRDVRKVQAIKTERIRREKNQMKKVSVGTEQNINKEEDEEVKPNNFTKEYKIPSVQEAIRRVGRPRKIILTRNIEYLSNGNVKVDTTFINKEIKEEPSVEIETAPNVKKKKRKKDRPEGKESRRQKATMKGPRVKHVCRSASLVLGQPVAMFSSFVPTTLKNKTSSKESTHELDSPSIVTDTSYTADVEKSVVEKAPEQQNYGRMRQALDTVAKEEQQQIKATKLAQSRTLARTLQDLGRQNCELLDGIPEKNESAAISVDFWESYDPEEICKTGFALIGSNITFNTLALCFLCGSGGLDKLIHCACCCEPYHKYCIEGGIPSSDETGNWWRVDWVCPRCTLCTACGKGSGPQLACQKCRKSYHTECLAADRLANRLHSADRPWVCPLCLRCKSCNLAAVYKFVGNLPLCKGCFKLRQKGNFCPLCQKCYEDNDFDTKMMECGQCKCWVHAKCEGLSNEKYEVLSFLPESVEFICRMCCEMPPASWWLAVEAEMMSGYLAVLKALSKNRKACDLLKWSPKKQSSVCVCRGGVRNRTLRFPDLSEQSDAESSDRLPSEGNRDEEQEVINNEDECFHKNKQDSSAESENVLTLVSESKDILSVEEKHKSLCDLRLKYNVRECTVNLKNQTSEELQLKVDHDSQLLGIPYQSSEGKAAQFSPHATSQSDSGIGSTDDELKSTTAEQCYCMGLEPWTKSSPTLLTIKKKVNSNEYTSLSQFHQDMQQVINSVQGLDLLKLYHHTLQDVFPWFDPKGSQVYDARKESGNITQFTKPGTTEETISGKRRDDCEIEDVATVLKDLLNLSPSYYYNELTIADNRVCLLCKAVGDGKTYQEGRLLYCGHNEWVHTNCALWSNEVFEEIDGSLQNVHSAISRSRHIRCSGCGKKGASVGCCNRNCPEAFHFTCARTKLCVFLENKAVYCLLHQDDTDDSKPLVLDSDYPVLRPVYVELERKKKKFVPKEEVRLMVGSLTVENIGEFVPEVSDQTYSIIPCEFNCTRLFWSSIEPWRIVQYHIRTKIVHSVLEYSTESDQNYTVDHSLEIVNLNISKKYNKNNKVTMCVNQSDIKQVIDYLLDTVCSKEDEGCLSDQQASDLLPPELKDAIFEDLPGDLLDGISMQDIFPKMMSYDDVTLMDSKHDKEYKYDSNSDVESVHNSKRNKSDADDSGSDLGNKSDKPFRSSCAISFDNKLHQSKKVVRRKTDDRRINQHITEGKHNEEKENAGKWRQGRILQVDGAGDCSSESDVGSLSMDESQYTPVLHVRIQKSQGFEENQTENTKYRENGILQVDGTIDFSSCSESGSPVRDGLGSEWSLIDQVDGTVDFSSENEAGEEKPVKCSRCHRTYRTAQSYERHLQTCSVDYILSCSESDSSEEEKVSNPIEEVQDPEMLAPNTLYTVNKTLKDIEEENPCTPPQVIECVYQPSQDSMTEINNINGLSSSSLCSSMEQIHPTYTTKNFNSVITENKHMEVSTNVTYVNLNSSVVQNGLMDIENSDVNHFTKINSDCDQINNVHSMAPCIKESPIRTRLPRAYVRRKKITPVISTPHQITSQPQQIIEYQATPSVSVSNPTLILQQVPTQNMIPTYVDSFTQQSSTHNIQYIATLDSHDKTQYLTSNPLMPGTFQLQTTPIGLQSVMPTVLGTIIQPNGVEQLVVNTPTPTVEVYSQQPSGMFITSSPMYVGMETVVSNTVMSSSQFVSGMLAASSYSATTTQVFQTAKPVVEVPQGYVVVNTPSNVVNTTPVQPTIPETVYPSTQQNSLPWSYNYQEVKERTTYQAVTTRQIIHEDENIDCIKMVNTQKTLVIDSPVVQEIELETEPVKKPLGPVHELTKMVENIYTTKEISPPPKVNNYEIEYEPQLLKESADQNLQINLISIDLDIKQNQIFHTDCMAKPIVSESSPKTDLEDKIIKPEPIKVNLEPIKKVNGKRLSPKSLINKSIPNNQSLKFNKVKESINRVPLHENKIIKRHGEGKPKKNNTLVKNSSCPKIIFEINSQDGFSISSPSLIEAWQKVFNAVQAARVAKKLPPLPQNPFLSDLRALGLDNNSVRYVLEQLPGVGHCVKYKPMYHKPRIPVMDDSSSFPQENKSGCARTEPFNIRNKYDMFSWLASRHRRPPKLLVNSDSDIVNGNSRRATSLNLPMAMRFRHLRETSKEAVGVFRSDIHGRGLFCLRDIDSGEMVIEYAGEVVRSGLTDKRERYYTSKGIGCYMFRIDDQFVVDATMRGNAARFINHSCEPNCYSRVVDILGKKHILIFALRRIPQGEELTYDYKFPLEDEKIICHCLSRKCRKYLN